MMGIATLCLFSGLINADLALMWENGTKFPYGDTPVEWDIGGETEKLGEILGKSTTSDSSLLDGERGFLTILGLWWAKYEGIPKAVIYIRFITNLLLWLVSFIALVIIIYSFYQMFFSEDSKGIEQVKKNLTGVAIALVIIGLSRFIVSFIFDFYQSKLLNAS